MAMVLSISSQGTITVQARGYSSMSAFDGINVAVDGVNTWTSPRKFGSMSAITAKQDWVSLSSNILNDGVVGLCEIASTICDQTPTARALDAGTPSLNDLYQNGISASFTAPAITACTVLPAGFSQFFSNLCTSPDTLFRTSYVNLGQAHLPSIAYSGSSNTIGQLFSSSLPAFNT